jgi:cyclase
MGSLSLLRSVRSVAPAVLLLLLAAAAALPAAAQDRDFSKVEIKVIPVAGKVYMLQGAGGNIGVSAGPDGLLIVDDQFAPLADKIRAALKGIVDAKLKFILNTHWHGDHTGGNEAFGPDAPVVAQTNVRKRLEHGQQLHGEAVAPAPAKALPVITFDDSLSIHFNGEEIKALHFPHGHTDGDSVIVFTGSNVVHMGDDFFAGGFPFVDLESGGSVQGLIDAVGKILPRLPKDARIIPGHGPLSTVGDLKAYHSMLVDTTAIVRGRMRDGKSREQIQAEGLPEKFKPWGTGYIDTKLWLGTIYDSLKSPAPPSR